VLVAIDGPAGAGKSTVAQRVAAALGFTYLNTGFMYRAAALAAQRGLDPKAVPIDVEDDRYLLAGEDVTDLLQDPELSQATSRLSTDPAVREALVERQRTLMTLGDWVAEGRDIGTVVAPQAEVKVWLTAALAERARRRGLPEAEVAERDERDATREVSPMVRADDAVEVDSTDLDPEQVVARIVALADAHRTGAGA
jgi:cytidylate kinase